MRAILKLAAIPAAILATAAVLQGFAPLQEDPGYVTFEHQSVAYRASGEFLRDGTPVNGPLTTIRPAKRFAIMQGLVTRAAYDGCVAAGACAALDQPGLPDGPAIGLNFNDANAFAAWMTASTGITHRLPTDTEWAVAAGSRYRDDALTEISDPTNPARRWLATYDAESAEIRTVDPVVRPVGGFGANEHGLLDVAANVWEWTSTCYDRTRIDTGAGTAQATPNCMIRIAEGAHRAYMLTFFRDPKAGACSVGVPPTHLGLRLVREAPGPLARLARALKV